MALMPAADPPAARQLSVLDVPAGKAGCFCVYHDESGTDRTHARFQLHGALLVDQARWAAARAALAAARQGYAGRLHFVELRDNARNPKARIAAAWLRLYLGELSQYCFYKCMIADTQAPAFDPARFPQPYHLYNHTALLAVFGAVTWSLTQYDDVELALYSERLSRAAADRFTTDLPRELLRRARRRKPGARPRLSVPAAEVALVPGDPRQAAPELQGHCEFIQLTDVLTGAVAQALNAQAAQRVKLDLGQLAAAWIEDARQPPWRQRQHLHRRFSVSCFPNAQGGFYNVPLGIATRGQMRLFE
jgi:hypothetical protein